jgi:hypothetical protein
VDEDNSAPTITLDFKLYCEDGWKKGALGTVMMTVGIVSVTTMGFISNKYGRKLALVVS